MALQTTMNAHEAFQKCRLISLEVMSISLRGCTNQMFDASTATLLRNTAQEVEDNRRKKNIGVISGSAAGIVGGGLGIAGVALAPFTFGASLGFLASGVALGAAGASVTMGFSLDKFFRDRNRASRIKPVLEELVDVAQDLANTTVFLHVSLKIIQYYEEHFHYSNRRVSYNLSQSITSTLITVTEMQVYGVPLHDLLHSLSNSVGRLLGHVNDLMRIAAFERHFGTLIDQAKSNPFDILKSSVDFLANMRRSTRNGTFLMFVIDILRDDNPSTAVISANAAVARGGLLIMQTADVTDDFVSFGTNVARLARGVSVAGIVLGAVGIVIDIGFLGHAIYDLTSDDYEDFSKALIDTAIIIEKIHAVLVAM